MSVQHVSGFGASHRFYMQVKSNPPNARRTARRLPLLVLAGLLLLAVVCHGWLLRCAGRLLVVDQSTAQFPSALILGGDGRFDIVQKLYANGQLEQALVFHDSGSNLVRFGILPPAHEAALEQLRSRDIPDDAILVIDRKPTHSELDDLAIWMQQHDDARIQVLTDRFASRRTRYFIDLALSDSLASRIRVVGLADRRFDESNWWQSRIGIKSFVSSTLGLLHSYCVGLQPPPKSDSWDPVEFEQRLK